MIEDTAEIQIQSPNLVRFEARAAEGGLPAVTIRTVLICLNSVSNWSRCNSSHAALIFEHAGTDCCL